MYSRGTVSRQEAHLIPSWSANFQMLQNRLALCLFTAQIWTFFENFWKVLMLWILVDYNWKLLILNGLKVKQNFEKSYLRHPLHTVIILCFTLTSSVVLILFRQYPFSTLSSRVNQWTYFVTQSIAFPTTNVYSYLNKLNITKSIKDT